VRLLIRKPENYALLVVSVTMVRSAAASVGKGAAGGEMPYADARYCGPATVARRVAQELALSRRETEVLLAAAAGKCIKETAADLGVSEKAVQYFWTRIFAKSRCASQVQVLALLLRHATSSPAR
jgi:DNA-binding CsgD family transcriptional regulator